MKLNDKDPNPNHKPLRTRVPERPSLPKCTCRMTREPYSYLVPYEFSPSGRPPGRQGIHCQFCHPALRYGRTGTRTVCTEARDDSTCTRSRMRSDSSVILSVCGLKYIRLMFVSIRDAFRALARDE
eukprot:scaffold63507_cov21-Prasinocladus_malaysianus.AAC.1